MLQSTLNIRNFKCEVVYTLPVLFFAHEKIQMQWDVLTDTQHQNVCNTIDRDIIKQKNVHMPLISQYNRDIITT